MVMLTMVLESSKICAPMPPGVKAADFMHDGGKKHRGECVQRQLGDGLRKRALVHLRG